MEAAGENGHLAVLNGREVLYLVEQRAAGRPPLVTDVDVHLPSHLTASGRAVLALLPPAQVRALYPTPGSFTDLTGAGPRTLRLADAQYRRLATIASDRDLPVSTLARLAILEYLDQAAQPASGPIDLTAVTAALREVLRPGLLKAG